MRYKLSSTFEMGVLPYGQRRADVVGLSVRGQITIIEVKSGVADFKADRKWRDYLPACDRFYFCVGHDHWRSHDYEIRKEIAGTVAGVLVLGEDGYATVAVPARTSPMTDEKRLSILARLAWRNSDRNCAKNRRTRRSLEVTAVT